MVLPACVTPQALGSKQDGEAAARRGHARWKQAPRPGSELRTLSRSYFPSRRLGESPHTSCFCIMPSLPFSTGVSKLPQVNRVRTLNFILQMTQRPAEGNDLVSKVTRCETQISWPQTQGLSHQSLRLIVGGGPQSSHPPPCTCVPRFGDRCVCTERLATACHELF